MTVSRCDINSIRERSVAHLSPVRPVRPNSLFELAEKALSTQNSKYIFRNGLDKLVEALVRLILSHCVTPPPHPPRGLPPLHHGWSSASALQARVCRSVS